MNVPRGLPGLIRQGKKITILTHRNPDGDAVGSLLALAIVLRAAGKQVRCLLPEGYPLRYDFLFSSGVASFFKAPFTSASEITFVLDCGDLSRAAGLPEEGRRGRLVNIDHHHGNNLFGDLNMVDGRASCAGELIERLIKVYKLPLTPAAAECLYTALLTDTGSFQHVNTTVSVFSLAARLAEAGASPTRVAAMVYLRRSPGEARLLGQVLAAARIEKKGRLVWSVIRRREMSACGIADKDVESEDYLAHLRSMAGVKVAVLLREFSSSEVRVSLRGKPGWRVDKLAAALGGGGHKLAAGCTLPGGLERARKRLFAEIEKQGLVSRKTRDA